MAKPKKKILNLLQDKIENEGFDYCFVDYSDFKEEIKDEKYNELYDAFINARKEFRSLLEIWGIELEN